MLCYYESWPATFQATGWPPTLNGTTTSEMNSFNSSDDGTKVTRYQTICMKQILIIASRENGIILTTSTQLHTTIAIHMKSTNFL